MNEILKSLYDRKSVRVFTEEEIAEILERSTGDMEEIPVINTKEWDSSSILAVEIYYETDNIYILPSTTNKIILKEYELWCECAL